MASPASASLRTRTRQDYVFWQAHQTRWNDNDQYAHLNNAVVYALFDSVINSYLIAHCGLTPPHTELIGLVVSSHAQFFAPTGFPAALELGLRLAKLGESSVAYEVGVFEQGRAAPVVVGGYTHVFVDSATRKSRPMSGEIRAGLARLLTKESEPRARL